MSCGIYVIENLINGKKYIGKSKNIEQRFYQHKYLLTRNFRLDGTNRYLYDSVNKYGIENFRFYIIEELPLNESLVSQREFYWMDFFKTTECNHGYNLRRDSSTGMIVHEKTRKLMSDNTLGEKNPNYGKKWSEEKKDHMSKLKKEQHSNNAIYNDEWKLKLSSSSKKHWSDSEKRKLMGKKVAKAKRKYDFLQFDLDGNFIKFWDSVEDIVSENKGFKWQNIYAVTNGYKPTYMGFIWKKQLKKK